MNKTCVVKNDLECEQIFGKVVHRMKSNFEYSLKQTTLEKVKKDIANCKDLLNKHRKGEIQYDFVVQWLEDCGEFRDWRDSYILNIIEGKF